MRHGAKLEERDFFHDRFLKNELLDQIGNQPISLVFSWRSPSFRMLRLKRDNLDPEQLLSMMIEEPRLIRRPLVKIGDMLFVGGDLEALSKALD